jgi:hypothetical protein
LGGVLAIQQRVETEAFLDKGGEILTPCPETRLVLEDFSLYEGE